MSAGPESQAQFAADTAAATGDIIENDKWKTQQGDPLLAAGRSNVEGSLSPEALEIQRCKDAVDQVVDSMDSDANLLRQLLEERQGWKGAFGLIYRINHNTLLRDTITGAFRLPSTIGKMIKDVKTPPLPPTPPGGPISPPVPPIPREPTALERWWETKGEASLPGFMKSDKAKRLYSYLLDMTEGVGKAAVIGYSTKALLTSVFGMGLVPTAAISGGVSGFIMSYRRAKERNESASGWMAELGILSDKDGVTAATRIQDPTHTSDDSLIWMLGILKNAIDDRRIRGDSSTKMELASKYRLIRDELGKREEEKRLAEKEMTPLMKELSEAIKNANKNGIEISKFASNNKEIKAAYEKILGLKKKIERKTIYKGVITGVAVGATMGALKHFGGPEKLLAQIKEYFHIDSPEEIAAAHQEAINHAITAKAEALQGQVINASPVPHGVNTMPEGAYESPRVPENLPGHNEALQQEIGVHSENNAMLDNYHGGKLPFDQLSDAQQKIVQHTDSLATSSNPHASIEGLEGDDKTGFMNMIKENSSTKDIYNFATQHNIDLTCKLQNGQDFGTFLIQHKDAIASLDPDLQSFVISHPSVAQEILNAGSEIGIESPAFWETAVGKITVAAALASVGGSLVAETVMQKNIRKEIRKTFDIVGKETPASKTKREAEEKAKKDAEERAKKEAAAAAGGGARKRRGGASPSSAVGTPEVSGEEIAEKLEALKGKDGLIGKIDIVNNQSVIKFTAPAEAALLSSVLISQNTHGCDLPTGIPLHVTIENIDITKNPPSIEIDAAYQYDGEIYDYVDHYTKSDRSKLNQDIKDIEAFGKSDTIIFYTESGKIFKVNALNYSATPGDVEITAVDITDPKNKNQLKFAGSKFLPTVTHLFVNSN